jgi:SAM-dependent methyltransferase
VPDDVFGREYSASYDALYRDKDYVAECDLLESAAIRHLNAKPREVLDLGCGTGNHAAEWVRRGVRVHGIDRSPEMLESAVRKQALDSVFASRSSFSQGDVREVRVGREFDMVTMMFAVLGYQVTNADLAATLLTVRHHLVRGGLFACDFWYGPAVLAQRPSDRMRTIDIGSTRMIRWATTSLDTRQHTARVEFQLWKLEGPTIVSEVRESHVMRFLFAQELEFHLTVAGLELISLTAFPSLDIPVTDQTWNAFLVARAV